MTDKLKILIVDDNPVCCKLMVHAVESLPDTEVIDTASSGRIALEMLGDTKVDLVLLDLVMPDMDGLNTFKEILKDFPGTKVIMTSGTHADDADKAVKALQMGALDFLPKLATENENSFRDFRLRLMTIMGPIQIRRNLQKAKSLSGSSPPIVAKDISSPLEEPAPKSRKITLLLSRIDVVAIASSTGGPNALAEIIPKLPKNLGVPVLLVQHMPPLMTASLASSLNKKSSLKVKEAEDGDKIQPNVVYIAPGAKHMIVRTDNWKGDHFPRKFIGLNKKPPENSVRPSADVLFRSIARTYGGNILSVIMTGMGDDGMKGVAVMKEEGCYCLSQSEDSCVVYGMPKSVDQAGLSDENIPLCNLADRITKVVLNNFPKGRSK